MGWPAVIQAGIALAGSLLSNNAQSDEAAKQRGWQEGQSGTAHQREVYDLRAAGLNPILSAGGGGATTGSGAQAQLNDLGDSINKGMNTGIAMQQQKKDFEQKDAQIENTKADTVNKASESAQIQAQTRLIQEQTSSSAQDVRSKRMENEKLSKTLQYQVKKLEAEGKYAEAQQIGNLINSGMGSASSMVNMLGGRSLKNLIPERKSERQKTLDQFNKK